MEKESSRKFTNRKIDNIQEEQKNTKIIIENFEDVKRGILQVMKEVGEMGGSITKLEHIQTNK